MHALSPPDIESSSDAYAKRFAGVAGRFFLDRQEEVIKQILGDKRSASILDVGGGHAQLCGPLTECGHCVTVTGSTSACSARLALDPRNRTVRFVEADLSRMPFEDLSFDTALSIRTMAHVPDWRHFLSELCRVSMQSVVIDYPDHRGLNGLSAGLFGIKRRIERDTREYRNFFTSEIRDVFIEKGFRIVSIDRQFLLPMALHRAARGSAVLRAIERIADAVGLTRAFGNPGVIRADRIQFQGN